MILQKAKSGLVIQCYSQIGKVMNNILLIIKDIFCYFGSLRWDRENAIHSLKAWLSWGKMQSAGRKQGPICNMHKNNHLIIHNEWHKRQVLGLTELVLDNIFF